MTSDQMDDLVNTQPHVCRYVEQVDGSWNLSMFFPAESKRGEGAGGTVGTQPAWLKKIVDIAIVADAFQVVPHPPPGRVLWFELDDHGDFLTFRDPAK
jgi:hypothetical protein